MHVPFFDTILDAARRQDEASPTPHTLDSILEAVIDGMGWRRGACPICARLMLYGPGALIRSSRTCSATCRSALSRKRRYAARKPS